MKRSTWRPVLACLLLLALTAAGPSQAAPQTEVLTLGYNMAESVIPALQPMLRDDERVSAYGNQLIVRAEPERMQEIRALVAELDRKPAQLRISVANSGTTSGSERGFEVNSRFDTGVGDIVVGDGSNQTRIIRRDTRTPLFS